MFLSQPGMAMLASYHCPPMTVSMESAMMSRDWREKDMPASRRIKKKSTTCRTRAPDVSRSLQSLLIVSIVSTAQSVELTAEVFLIIL